MALHRTQVYVEEEQIQRLKIEALQEHIPFSELIRRAIDLFLKSKTKKINWDNDPLTQAGGKVKLSVTDAAQKHNRYLYEQKK